MPRRLKGQKGGIRNDHSVEVQALPEQAIQGDDSFDTSNEEDQDVNSASRWQASEQLASFLGTLHKPLTAFERTTICRKYPRPDVDAIYTPILDTYLSSLVPGDKAVDKEKKFLQDRLLDS